MKYLKTFEGESYHYMADYIMPEAKEKLLNVIKVLKENYIPFDLFYHIPKKDYLVGTILFKIYYYGTLSNKEKKIIKSLDMYYFSEDYGFTWPWEKTTEDNIQFLLDQHKYNL